MLEIYKPVFSWPRRSCRSRSWTVFWPTPKFTRWYHNGDDGQATRASSPVNFGRQNGLRSAFKIWIFLCRKFAVDSWGSFSCRGQACWVQRFPSWNDLFCFVGLRLKKIVLGWSPVGLRRGPSRYFWCGFVSSCPLCDLSESKESESCSECITDLSSNLEKT